jgi:hypothetical protein
VLVVGLDLEAVQGPEAGCDGLPLLSVQHVFAGQAGSSSSSNAVVQQPPRGHVTKLVQSVIEPTVH